MCSGASAQCVCVLLRQFISLLCSKGLLSWHNLLNWFVFCFLFPGTHWQSGDHEMMKATSSFGRWVVWSRVVRKEKRKLPVWVLDEDILADILRQVLAFCSVFVSFSFTPLTYALSLWNYTFQTAHQHHYEQQAPPTPERNITAYKNWSQTQPLHFLWGFQPITVS